MKKIYVLDYAETENQADAVAIMYHAGDADARIDELERALKSCLTVMERQRQSVLQLQDVAAEAIREAHKALMESGR